MNRYDIIFVVLVYRNTTDLSDFFNHNNVPNSKTIVVNSYYDEESQNEFMRIAKANCADFISVPNNGYGAGNNKGCKYALENYEFDYLVISNADILIDNFSVEVLNNYRECIIAPKLINLKGRNQNPSMPFAPSKVYERIRRWVFMGDHRKLLIVCYAYSRFLKIVFNTFYRSRREIFSAHGAFVILPYAILNKLYPLFNESMFLFCEEEHLARHAINNGIKTVYVPEILIRHKEDGSMSVASENLFVRTKQSFLEYYNCWFK